MSAYQRGYHAQTEQIHIQSSTSETKPAFPARRYYRAYCQADDDAVAAIREKYGIQSDEDAVRVALRLAAGDAIQTRTVAPAAKRIVKQVKAKAKG